jgi:hypothetical protein
MSAVQEGQYSQNDQIEKYHDFHENCSSSLNDFFCFASYEFFLTWHTLFVEVYANNMIGRFNGNETNSKSGISLWMYLRRYIMPSSANGNF